MVGLVVMATLLVAGVDLDGSEGDGADRALWVGRMGAGVLGGVVWGDGDVGGGEDRSWSLQAGAAAAVVILGGRGSCRGWALGSGSGARVR